jgi:hypothetical protein
MKSAISSYAADYLDNSNTADQCPPRRMRPGIYEQAVWQWVGLMLTLMVGAVILIWSLCF